jgi:FAD:protein FMN transferase
MRLRIKAVGLQPGVPARQALSLDAAKGLARKSAPLSLDLIGIAKSFPVDEMGRVMNTYGIKAWLAGIDGDMRGQGSKPGNSAGKVSLRRGGLFARNGCPWRVWSRMLYFLVWINWHDEPT